ncbi:MULTISPECIES: DUF6602 domain-containing protein [Paraburkholderia]|jgi:hypothetical protein|uniref:DUF6602 domain-containing protein n=1 Tax=Paraburkholderia TaxID=1822464 RepID=UPI0034619C4C
MSERIGTLIGHGPTVGTYRENLLQTVLRKHLPTYYHVATGFINGSPPQVDILIYDQVDYVPTFREGVLVSEVRSKVHIRKVALRAVLTSSKYRIRT